MQHYVGTTYHSSTVCSAAQISEPKHITQHRAKDYK